MNLGKYLGGLALLIRLEWFRVSPHGAVEDGCRFTTTQPQVTYIKSNVIHHVVLYMHEIHKTDNDPLRSFYHLRIRLNLSSLSDEGIDNELSERGRIVAQCNGGCGWLAHINASSAGGNGHRMKRISPHCADPNSERRMTSFSWILESMAVAWKL